MVSGPDGANRLLTISGQFDVGLSATGQANAYGQATNTFSVLVGPVLTRQQFYKATGTGSIVKTSITTQTSPTSFNYNINNIDADWDDESGKVELRMEVFVQALGTNNYVQVQGLNFQVSILYAATAA